MFQTEVTESRFYMWRAVFAMIHADGEVTDEEIEFAERYFENVPFTEDQKAVLREDLHTPQNLTEMWIGIAEPSDQADFFQFAQMLVWTDGDYDEQEKAIYDRLLAEQMNRFNKEEVAQQIRSARQAAAVRRDIEDREYKRQAKEVLGIGNVMKGIGGTVAKFTVPRNVREKLGSVMSWMEINTFEPPSDEVFNLWRAVFALAHADGKIDSAERNYIDGMMEVFRFAPEQQNVVREELDNPQSPASLFGQLEDQELQTQYFDMARTILWCDGEYHEKEQSIMNEIRATLDSEASSTLDLSWIDKAQPDEGSSDDNALKGVLNQMIDLTKKRAA